MSETTGRLLQLLGLLQSRRVWSGEELADRLGVTTRSVRRDVERLRDLGYPVHASKGHGGGYQLGAGAALPPLLLDPDEAVAMAVCLRLAAGGSVAGVGESALRALGKLDQVMPARLRSQVSAVHDATVTLTGSSESPVEPDVLMTLARACRDHEHVAAGYVDRAGAATQRRLEPYQLVTTGRRWYLLAYDRDRQDWRSLRLDRMADVRALGSTFAVRPAPDARRSSPTRSAPRPTATWPGSATTYRNTLSPNIFHRPRSPSNPTAPRPASSPPAPTTPNGWPSTWRCRATTSR
jgi:predicted DNA-binding transcriptional regulator YafY